MICVCMVVSSFSMVILDKMSHVDFTSYLILYECNSMYYVVVALFIGLFDT